MTSASDGSRDSAQMREFLDRFEFDLAESLCKVRPSEPQWQMFRQVLANSLNRVRAEFPDLHLGGLDARLCVSRNSPVDDAVREVGAMVKVALEQAGISREAADLLLSWIDFCVESRATQVELASRRLELDRK